MTHLADTALPGARSTRPTNEVNPSAAEQHPPRCRPAQLLRSPVFSSLCTSVLVLALAGCATPRPDDLAGRPAASPFGNPKTTQLPAPPAAAQAAVVAPPVPVDPVRPQEPVNLNDKAAQVDLWLRVRKGFAIPDLDTDLVREHERWYATRPDYVGRMTQRGSLYLFHIVEEVERRGMPNELALLPFIESAFNPQAVSSAKASGMWQFMAATGKDFDLRQNLFRDDRRDVLASTRAALDYLERLHRMFGDWHLALAAYNWGEGNVQRAIARNQKAGLPTDYLSLKMPDETRYYVPKLQAVENIIARPDAFALALPPVENHPYFLSVPIERDIDVALAARYAGLKLEEFKSLNPQMNKPVILAAGTPQVLLPYDNAASFAQRLSLHTGPLASWTAWVAPRTLRPRDAAQQVGMEESDLVEINRIPPRMLIKAGSTLLVPRAAHRAADVSEHIADNAMMSLAPDLPPLRQVTLKAGKRDTVATVARRYKLSAAQVAQWNKLSPSARFSAGQRVVVYLPQRAAVTRSAKPGNSKAVVRTAAKPSSKKVATRPAPRKTAASATTTTRTASKTASRNTMRASKD